MGPCAVIATYAATIIILLVLSILSIKLKWPGILKRLFISALVLGMLAYPIAFHQYTIRCFKSCAGDT